MNTCTHQASPHDLFELTNTHTHAHTHTRTHNRHTHTHAHTHGLCWYIRGECLKEPDYRGTGETFVFSNGNEDAAMEVFCWDDKRGK